MVCFVTSDILIVGTLNIGDTLRVNVTVCQMFRNLVIDKRSREVVCAAGNTIVGDTVGRTLKVGAYASEFRRLSVCFLKVNQTLKQVEVLFVGH